MTIDWYAPQGVPDAHALEYRLSESGEEWQEVLSTIHVHPAVGYDIHRVELTGLEPDATYDVRIPSGEFRFRTLPETLSRPVEFAAGGDIRHSQPAMEATNRQAAEHDLDFILWGGDLAYADVQQDRFYRWSSFFDAISNTLVRDDGRVIPVLAAIGNHEVAGGYYFVHDGYRQTDEWRLGIAPNYYSFFAFPGQPGFGVLDVGDYLSLIALDTDHSNPVQGIQTAWLERTLRERRDVKHVFPFYHVTAYPSHRAFDKEVQTRVRENWVPLFEAYGVTVAFENHDHTYKRTHPIRDGTVHPDGITYIGDGAWGVSTREPRRPDEVWYLEKTKEVRHLIRGMITEDEVRLEMIDQEGNVFDEYVREVGPGVPAVEVGRAGTPLR